MHSNIFFNKHVMGSNYMPDTVVRPGVDGSENESQELHFLGA